MDLIRVAKIMALNEIKKFFGRKSDCFLTAVGRQNGLIRDEEKNR